MGAAREVLLRFAALGGTSQRRWPSSTTLGLRSISPLSLLLLPHPVHFYKDAPQLGALGHERPADRGVSIAVEQAVVFFAVFAYSFARFVWTRRGAGVFSESSR